MAGRSMGLSPEEKLINAIQRNDAEAVDFLLEEGGIDIRKPDAKGFTYLHHAALLPAPRGKEIVKLLLTKGADINAKTPNGGTPLKFATQNGNLALANLLIERGAILEKVSSSQHAASSKPSEEKMDTLAQVRTIETVGAILGLGKSDEGEEIAIALNYTDGITRTVKTEGHSPYYIFSSIVETLEKYGEKIKTKKDPDLANIFNQITAAYQQTSAFLNLDEKVTPVEMLESYKSGKILLLPITVHEPEYSHNVCFALYKNTLLYCNRGAGARMETRAYAITEDEKARLLVDFAKASTWELFYLEKESRLSPRELTDEKVNQFFTDHVASFKSSEPLYACAQKPQKHGNCVYASNKSMIELLILTLLKENPSQENDLDELIEQAKEQYKKLTVFARNNCVEKLAAQLVEARESKNESAYQVCMQLAIAIAKEHHGQEVKDQNKNKAGEELQRIYQLLSVMTEAEQKQLLSAVVPEKRNRLVDIFLSDLSLFDNHPELARITFAAGIAILKDICDAKEWGFTQKILVALASFAKGHPEFESILAPIAAPIVEIHAKNQSWKFLNDYYGIMDVPVPKTIITAWMVHAAESKEPPLCLAAASEYRHFIKEILTLPVMDINAWDKSGHTALQYSTQSRDQTTCLRLLCQGADPLLASPQQLKSPLLIALEKADTLLVADMLIHGPKPTLPVDEAVLAHLKRHASDIVQYITFGICKMTDEDVLRASTENSLLSLLKQVGPAHRSNLFSPVSSWQQLMNHFQPKLEEIKHQKGSTPPLT